MATETYIDSLQGKPLLAKRARYTQNGTDIDTALAGKFDKNGYVGYKEGFWVGVKWPISTTYNSCFWKVCSFSVSNYWSISFELTATNLFFDSVGQETKVVTASSNSPDSVEKAVECRTKYIKNEERGYGNIMYYTIDNRVVTIYVKTAKKANVTQFLRLVSVTDLSSITNLTWYCEEAPGEQPSSPTKFTEKIVNVTPSVGTQTIPVYSDAYGKLQQCDPSQMSVGSATTATSAGKLTASKTIAISGGATGTATAFDGSANITIPVTKLGFGTNNAVSAIPLGYNSLTGPLSGDDDSPYVQWKTIVGKAFTVGGATYYGYVLNSNSSATFTYGGNSVTINNTTSNNWVVLVIDDSTYLGSASFTGRERCSFTLDGIPTYRRSIANNYAIGSAYTVAVNVGSGSFANATTSASLLAACASSLDTYSGGNSVASGNNSVASGNNSVASGNYSVASGQYSVASGNVAIASGGVSVASGNNSVASGSYSVASGHYSVAQHTGSRVDAYNGISGNDYQHVVGKWNVMDSNRAFVVGWGTAENARKNVMSVGTDGEIYFKESNTGLSTQLANKLDKTGDASNATSTFTKASGDTSTMTSGSKLSAIFTAISSFFASLKSLAFKDKASYNDLSSGVQSSLDKADSALQSHQSVTNNNPTLAWGATSKVGSVGSTDLRVTMPANPATGKQDALPTTGTASDTYAINISGNAATAGSVAWANVTDKADASTSAKGIVQLQDSIGSTETSTDKAATPHAVRAAIDSAVSSAYHAAGTKTVAQLTSALLVVANAGDVYNMTDAGETTADFVEGAGKPIRIGDNVGICDVGGGVYKFDLLSGFVDLSNYKTKQSAVADPTVPSSGTTTSLSFIDTISQDANGVITPTKKDMQDGTTSQKGVVQLEDSYSSTSTTKAATPNAVKAAYDLASGKQAALPTTGTASATYAINVSGNASTASAVEWANVENKATASTGGVYGIVTYTTVLLDEV